MNDRTSKKKKKKSDKIKSLIDGEQMGSTSNTRDGNTIVMPARKKTEAEIKFEEVQRKRLEAKTEKIAAKSHKDRVAEFNNYLESLSEHHDIPRVGPG